MCKDLIAGQNIDAGDVCMSVNGENLVVTYTTSGEWELKEAHLWTGGCTSDMPQTKKGNPKIGNFPYNSGDITGSTSHSFTVPLDSLCCLSFEEECNQDALCSTIFYAAAHASVGIPDGSGGYLQTETGWGSGDQIVERGSWAMYFDYEFVCDGLPPEGPPSGCETAFAVGQKELWDIIDPATGDPITNRWGWQLTVKDGDAFDVDIYAGAAQNNLTKGTHVGILSVRYDGAYLEVTYNMFAGYTLDETHLYAGNVDVDTGAPGQYGNLNELLGGAASDRYYLEISGDTIYIVAHAVVCGFPEE